MRKYVCVILLSFLFIFNVSAQLHIGLVNTDEIVKNMKETKEAQEKWNEASEQYQLEYDKLNVEFNRLFDEYNSMSSSTPQAIKENKTRMFQEYSAKIVAYEKDVQQDLDELQKELMKPIYSKIKQALDYIGESNGYDLILEYSKGETLFHSAKIEDVTDIVLNYITKNDIR